MLVIVHGGYFVTGSSADYPARAVADHLVARGIIVVTINYRLVAYRATILSALLQTGPVRLLRRRRGHHRRQLRPHGHRSGARSESPLVSVLSCLQ